MKLGASVAALSCPAVAAAGEPVVSRSDILDDMHSYYGGERASACIIGAFSLVSARVGAVLVTRDGDF